MFILAAIIIVVVSLLAYAGIAAAHDRVSEARHQARTFSNRLESIRVESHNQVSSIFEAAGIRQTVAIRHPKDSRCRRTGGGCYISRNS